MSQVIEFLQGKRTYLVSAAALITVAVQYLDGTMDLGQAVLAGLGALGLATMRAGISKIGQ